MSLRDDVIELLGGRYTDKNGANNFEEWLNFYRDEAHYLSADTYSLNLPSSICSEFAKLVTLEMESSVDDKEINKYYQFVLKKARRFVEYGLALGDVILKPYLADGGIACDIAIPTLFIPLNFDSFGRINHIAFIDRFEKLVERPFQESDKIYYTRLEIHERTRRGYKITNKAFRSERPDRLGDEIKLHSVDRWKDFAEGAFIPGYSEKNLFGHFKNPQANNLDLESPMGISCFSRAVSLIQDADEQYSRIIWEYEGSELAIDADINLFKETGDLPSGKDRLFRNLGQGLEDGFYNVFSPAIRDSSLFNGLNKILMRIEFVCGLAYGTLSDLQEISRTATEIKASKQRSYATVVDIQSQLQDALRDMAEAMCVWQDIKNGRQTVRKEFPAVSFTFDDSIIVDSETEQGIMLQEVAAGLIKPEIYLMKRYGVTEKDARDMLPVIGDEIDEEVEEIE